jgi:hypothetical protein
MFRLRWVDRAPRKQNLTVPLLRVVVERMKETVGDPRKTEAYTDRSCVQRGAACALQNPQSSFLCYLVL